MPAPVWGKASPQESVTVEFNGQTLKTEADSEGSWSVWLEPMQAQDGSEMRITGENAITLKNIAVGEVWLCAGQSNMETYAFHVRDKEDPTLLDDLNYPNFRYFRVGKETPPEPIFDASGRWTPIVADNLRAINNISGIGLMLGRDLSNELDVPVGIIQVAWGGSRVEAWLPKEVLESRPEFRIILEEWADRMEALPDSFEAFKKQPKDKESKNYVRNIQETPTRIYNGMLSPIIPYAIRGIVWYQGESNAYQPEPYGELFPAMITSWRERWKKPDLPFIFVQLPAYREPSKQPQANSFWGDLRNSQAAALALPETYMVVSIDIGDADIHPNNKTRLEPRIYKTVAGGVYHKDVHFKSPKLDTISIDGKAIIVSLKDMDEPLSTPVDEPIKGFAIAGENQKFHWAEAAIQGNQIKVWSDEVSSPVAVRYAYGEFPLNNLKTESGIPVAPFKSDNW
ncbi:sialate O-acetylesterase [Cerasicoccus frondis]|uniref:sialate O-acetylesterase n=1 Tax=Cerasicoccus frondis TaxID=490090 RepID=UPI002852A844|nr:sialate O-acetylesterase [Cerasicoccus frondis]